jgi:hypothetical protein
MSMGTMRGCAKEEQIVNEGTQREKKFFSRISTGILGTEIST